MALTDVSAQETIKLFNIEWSLKNLDVVTFRNGDTIAEAKTALEWKEAGILGDPAWCYADNDPSNTMMGKLYNFHAVTDERNLAPEGFIIPAIGDFPLSIQDPKTESVFKGNSAKNRYSDGEFSSVGGWWSRNSSSSQKAHVLNIDKLWGVVENKGNGYFVRCMKANPDNR